MFKRPDGFGRAPKPHKLNRCPICKSKAIHDVDSDIWECELCRAKYIIECYKVTVVSK